MIATKKRLEKTEQRLRDEIIELKKKCWDLEHDLHLLMLHLGIEFKQVTQHRIVIQKEK